MYEFSSLDKQVMRWLQIFKSRMKQSTGIIFSVKGTIDVAPQKSVAVMLNCAERGVAENVVSWLPVNAEPDGNVPGVSDQTMGPVPPETRKLAL